MNKERIQRRQAKTRGQRLLNIMKEEFNVSPRMAQELLLEAETCLIGESKTLRPGQMRAILVQEGARHGRALSQLPTKEVVWTVDAGAEDEQVRQEHGSVALRRTRIQRLLSEAVEQGAAASQEDLAQALHVSVRTIKRDCQALQQTGIVLPTRGQLQGIGRGQTHKGQIVGLWLQGSTYDQVARRTQHSLTSIKRYVQAFVRTVQLQQQGFTTEEICLILQVNPRLVAEYLSIHAEHDSSFCRQRLAEELARFGVAQQVGKRGVR